MAGRSGDAEPTSVEVSLISSPGVFSFVSRDLVPSDVRRHSPWMVFVRPAVHSSIHKEVRVDLDPAPSTLKNLPV